MLERLRTGLAESHSGGQPPFTASFGLTDSAEAPTVDALVHIADSALYASKAAGRDCITLGTPPLDGEDLPALREFTAEPQDRPARNGRRTAALHEAADEEEPTPIR